MRAQSHKARDTFTLFRQWSLCHVPKATVGYWTVAFMGRYVHSHFNKLCLRNRVWTRSWTTKSTHIAGWWESTQTCLLTMRCRCQSRQSDCDMLTTLLTPVEHFLGQFGENLCYWLDLLLVANHAANRERHQIRPKCVNVVVVFALDKHWSASCDYGDHRCHVEVMRLPTHALPANTANICGMLAS